MRTSDAHYGRENVISVESTMTRVQMMNHSPHLDQQTFRQVNGPFQTSESLYSHGVYQGFNVENGGMGFGQPYRASLPISQILPSEANCRQPPPMLMDDGDKSRDYNYSNNGQYLNVRESRRNRSVHYQASADDISELTDTRMEGSQQMNGNAPPRCVSMEEDENSATRHSTFSFIDTEDDEAVRSNSKTARNERFGSKLKRSSSSRSLLFSETERGSIERMNQVPRSILSKGSSEDETNASSVKSNSREESEQNAICFLNAMKSLQVLNADDPTMMRSFLVRPCPKGLGWVRCVIKRNKGIKNALFPEYRVYLKDTNVFLMTSKKRVGNTTSNYLISMGRNDFDNRQSPNVLGKLRSNFLGTEYTIYDQGNNPQYDSSSYDDDGDGKVRCELGVVLYDTATNFGAKGPRNLKACVGKVDTDGNPTKVWQPTNETDDRMVISFKKKEPSQMNNLIRLISKPPSWNKYVKAYAFNFNGTVIMPSVKNFQLTEESDPENILLQFGRIGKDEFSLDVQWPLSPFQAFAFALSSFDSKLGCD
jgi:tubby-related protein 1